MAQTRGSPRFSFWEIPPFTPLSWLIASPPKQITLILKLILDICFAY